MILILKNDRQILSVVQVPDDLPTEALDEARTIAGRCLQEITVHEKVDCLGPADLENWVIGLNEALEGENREIQDELDAEAEGVFDEDDDHDMPWEDDMKHAVHQALELITWNPEVGTAEVPDGLDNGHDGGPTFKTCRSLSDVQDALGQVAETAWYGSVPFDGGEAVFSFDRTVADEMLEDREEENLRRLGWI